MTNLGMSELIKSFKDLERRVKLDPNIVSINISPGLTQIHIEDPLIDVKAEHVAEYGKRHHYRAIVQDVVFLWVIDHES